MNTIPNDYNSVFKIAGLKENSTLGLSSGSFYSAVVGIRGYSDKSGGNAHEIAFNGDGGIFVRNGADTSWNDWAEIMTTRHCYKDGFNVTVPRYSDFGDSTDTYTYFENVLRWICKNHPGVYNRAWMFNAIPNGQGWSVVYIYSTNDTVNGLPLYANGIYIPLDSNGTIYTYGCEKGIYYAKSNTPAVLALSGTTLNITT